MSEQPELLPCPVCGGGTHMVRTGGQTWWGRWRTDPQYYYLYHNGVIPEGDGFQSCSATIRARTELELVSIWNTRATLAEPVKVKPNASKQFL